MLMGKEIHQVERSELAAWPRGKRRSRRAAGVRCYGVIGWVPQSGRPSPIPGVFVTWKRPVPSALMV
jgi:hypothetical protein